MLKYKMYNKSVHWTALDLCKIDIPLTCPNVYNKRYLYTWEVKNENKYRY